MAFEADTVLSPSFLLTQFSSLLNAAFMWLMTRYTLHYNSRCPDCVRLAQWNRRLDWLGRFERTTKPSPIGMPDIGDIHVIDNRNAKIFSGAYATQIVCQNIPAYWPVALLMKFPFVFEKVAGRKPGCNGDRCSTE